ncbi:MAG: asparagine--tRNA ligase, partial [Hyphomicrobiaceae bacterium]
MKKQFFISDSKDFVGTLVTVRGWVFNKRSSGSLIFLHIRDGSGNLQATVGKNDISPELFSQIQSLPIESSIEVMGNLKQEPRAPGGYEISVQSL